MEDYDGSFHAMDIDPSSKTAKAIAHKPLRRMVVWRRDQEDYPNIKDIVSDSNRDSEVRNERVRKRVPVVRMTSAPSCIGS